MERSEFLKLVRKEIISLKKKATSEELCKLNFSTLAPSNTEKCIYGQMTGDCDSDRARELSPKTFKWVDDDNVIGDAYTALEKYILEGARGNDNMNKHIIDFLKGNVKRLRTLE